MKTYHLERNSIILASASASRQKMLKDAGLQFLAIPAIVDEDSLKSAAISEGMSAPDAATLIAEMKARQISAQHPEAYVLGSDQLLTCGDDWFSKPTNGDEAKDTLRALSGKTHKLVTAGVIYRDGQRIWQHVEAPEVSIRQLSEDDIESYLDAMGDDAYATPGVYMMEGYGAQIISNISGCPYSVLGLPFLHVLSFLRGHGLKWGEDQS